MKKILIGNFKGPPGVQGRSAYQVAVNEGYVGSEAQWIESLHSIVPGPKGETGIQGYQGASITGLVFNADGSISVSIHDPKTNTDSTIAAGNALTSSLLAQMQQYVNNAGSSANAAAASQSAAKMSENNSALSAENASMSATASANSAASAAESAEAAKAISQGSVGFYTTSASLEAAHPIGKDGNWAIIGKTDTIWVWDGDLSIWKDTGEKTDLSNYYTKPQADELLSTKADRTPTVISGNPLTVPMMANSITVLKVNGLTTQAGTGTPSPTNIRPITGVTPSATVGGTTYSVSTGTLFTGDTADLVSGTVHRQTGYIASYAGQTLPGAWISDRDAYSAGATPTTGAQVVYQLATPTDTAGTGNSIPNAVGNVTVSAGNTVNITLCGAASAKDLTSEIVRATTAETSLSQTLTDAAAKANAAMPRTGGTFTGAAVVPNSGLYGLTTRNIIVTGGGAWATTGYIWMARK